MVVVAILVVVTEGASGGVALEAQAGQPSEPAGSPAAVIAVTTDVGDREMAAQLEDTPVRSSQSGQRAHICRALGRQAGSRNAPSRSRVCVHHASSQPCPDPST